MYHLRAHSISTLHFTGIVCLPNRIWPLKIEISKSDSLEWLSTIWALFECKCSVLQLYFTHRKMLLSQPATLWKVTESINSWLCKCWIITSPHSLPVSVLKSEGHLQIFLNHSRLFCIPVELQGIEQITQYLSFLLVTLMWRQGMCIEYSYVHKLPNGCSLVEDWSLWKILFINVKETPHLL